MSLLYNYKNKMSRIFWYGEEELNLIGTSPRVCRLLIRQLGGTPHKFVLLYYISIISEFVFFDFNIHHSFSSKFLIRTCQNTGHIVRITFNTFKRILFSTPIWGSHSSQHIFNFHINLVCLLIFQVFYPTIVATEWYVH